MVMRNKPVKGPSNQSGFGTPGTQQTAQRNVRTGGMDPYNNFAKQAQRQGKSAYQRSLTPGARTATPTPGLPPRAPQGAPQRAPQRTPQRVPQMPFRRATDTGIGARELPRTGYEMLGGLPHEELLGMNQRFGLSNLTRIPGQAPVPVIPRAEVATPFTRVDGDFARATGSFADGFTQIGLKAADYSKPEYWESRTREDGSTVDYSGREDWEGTDTGGRADFVRTDPDGNQQTGKEFKYRQGGEAYRIMAFDEWSEDHPNPVDIDGNTYWLSDEDLEQFKNTNKYDETATDTALEEIGEKLFGKSSGARKTLKALDDVYGGNEYTAPEDDELQIAKDALADVLVKLEEGVIGYPEEEFEKVKDDLAKQSEYDLQNTLSQMYRQYAAMGISPASGAFAAANNQIVGQALNTLLDKYTQLDLANLEQMEQDEDNAIKGLFDLASAQQQLLQTGIWEYKQSMLVPLEALKVFDETVGQLFIDLLEMSGGQMDKDMSNLYWELVAEFTANAEKLKKDEWSQEQWSAYLAEVADELGELQNEAQPF